MCESQALCVLYSIDISSVLLKPMYNLHDGQALPLQAMCVESLDVPSSPRTSVQINIY